MKPYPKYKDSGVEWIGEVPDLTRDKLGTFGTNVPYIEWSDH